MVAQVVVDDAQRIDDALNRQRRRHVLQRQMRGSQRDPQRPLAGAGQHHHHVRRMGALGEILGMAGEGHAGIVDGALLERCGDDRVELTGERAVDCAIQQIQHVTAVGRVEFARLRQHAERLMLHANPLVARTATRAG
jgi:hypothetical protein